MAHLDIKLLFKRALERLKDSERVRDDDPSLEHLKKQVVRSIAEEVVVMERGRVRESGSIEKVFDHTRHLPNLTFD